MHNGVLRVQIA